MSTFLNTDVSLESITSALGGCGLALGDSRRVRHIVLDTFDGRLHSAGLRLELREGARRELVLAANGASPPAHLAWDGPAPGLAVDLPAGPFGSRIGRVIRERRLLPVLEIASTRHEAIRCDRRGKPVVTVNVHDEIVVGCPTTESPLPRVVHVANTIGHPVAKDRAVSALVSLGATAVDGDLIDAVLALTGLTLRGKTSSPTVPLDRRDDALEAFRRVLRNLLASIHDNLPGTLDETDPEFLHDLRVALRRTRSVLAEGKGVLPDDVRARFRAGFAELAAATGRARDLDVYVLGWSDMVEPLGPVDSSLTAPILVELERRRRAAHKELAKVFRRRETRELLESWRRWLDDPEVDDRSGGPIGAFIATRISKAQRGLLRDARAITPQSPAAQLHDLRKDAKKLRYLLECFESVLPAKASKKFIAQLKALQDNLGDHQDAEVQAAELRTLSHDLHARARLRADQLLAAGRLIDHLERTRQRERAEFTEHFAAYDTATNRSLLDAMLAKATKA